MVILTTSEQTLNMYPKHAYTKRRQNYLEKLSK